MLIRRASLVALMFKNLPSMPDNWDQYLGWEYPLEKGMATLQYFCLGIPWTEEPGKLQFMELQESDTTEQLYYYCCYYYMLRSTHINFTSSSVEIKAGNHNYILKTDPKAGNGKIMVLIQPTV